MVTKYHLQAGRPEVLEKNCPIFQKVAKKVSKLKTCQNKCIKAEIESPKYLHQTTFETLKCLQ